MSALETIPDWAAELGVARIEDYFGAWAYEEQRFAQAVEAHRNIDTLRAHVEMHKNAIAAAGEAKAPTPGSVAKANTRDDGVMVLQLRGSLMKYVGSLSTGTSTVWTRQVIRAAKTQSDIKAAVIAIESPGGTVAGTHDLAEEIAGLASVMPVVAFIEDIAASAAYWIACACNKIIATPTSLVGCIGTYNVICDYSAKAAMEGIKVHVIRAGAMKGAGVPGTAITEEILADVQRVTNDLNAHFLARVEKGRKLSAQQVAEVADGRVWIASVAQEKGLIDSVGTFDQAIAIALKSVESKAGNTRPKRELKMSEAVQTEVASVPAPKPATFAELKSAFPKADAAWREQCQEKNLTLAQAQAAYVEKVEADLAKANADLAKAQEEAKVKAATPPKPAAVPPIFHVGGADAEAGEGTATERWNALVAECSKGGKVAHDDAIRAAVRKDSELHAAYLDEANKVAQESRRGLAHNRR